jgi:dTDP-4-dehydrorhamnose reductase
MKILILGSNGMLGQMAYKYFSSKYNVEVYNKRFSIENRHAFLEDIRGFGDCVIINCIGRIKQKLSNVFDLYFVNSILPFDLANGINEGQTLIQPSTDCVYSGTTSSFYSSSTLPDAIDDYGWSKVLGEKPILNKNNCYLIRVSIIGSDNTESPKGLLGWFLSNNDNDIIQGYTDHWWNGITTLEWCKKVESLVFMDKNAKNSGKILQLGTNEKQSKFELINYFQTIYNTKFIIQPYLSGIFTNRCLIPDYPSEHIFDQLKELKEFDNV